MPGVNIHHMVPIFSVFLMLAIVLVRASDYESNLYSHLLEDYEPLERPVQNDSQSVVVTLGIAFQQIIDIDEKNQLMLANMYLNYKWHDFRLMWEPREYGGITEIRLPFGRIWKPDILLYNSVSDGVDSSYPVNYVVRSSGDVEWMPPVLVKSTCKIDITWIPFDDQKCTLKYSSWTYSGLFISLQAGDVDTSDYRKSEEWDLMGISGVQQVNKYECCPEPYYDITFTIWLRRTTLYMGLNFIIPCLLISLMALLEFILPTECGEKLTLGISIFMSLYVYLQMIGSVMPPTSDSVPLIGTYFSCVTIVVSAAQVPTVLVINLHNRNPNMHTMSPIMRKWFLNWLPWLLMMQRPGYVATRNGFVKIDDDFKRKRRRRTSALAAAACESFPLYKLKPITTTISGEPLLLNSPDASIYSLSTVTASVSRTNSNRSTTMSSFIQRFSNVLRSKTPSSVFDPAMNKAYELNFVELKIREEDEERTAVSDWKFAARVLDRLSLIVFSTVLVSCTLAIMFASPALAI